MGLSLTRLAPDELPAAQAVLSAACAFERAAEVAGEKLFGTCPRGSPTALAARLGGDVVGVAAACCDRVRVLAVDPAVRGRGIGGQLLEACEAAITGRASRIRLLDEPGNYLAPGIDERDQSTLRWLERRGYTRGELRTNLRVEVRGNPRVTVVRAKALATAAGARGYETRRARRDERDALAAAVAAEFGGAWPFEIARAVDQDPPAVHTAWADGALAGFAAHDGNNRGLGWFGPAGTWPAHRGRGLGEALLVACLVDVALVHATAEIAWIGPRDFYARSVGIVGERRFVAMSKDCGMVGR